MFFNKNKKKNQKGPVLGCIHYGVCTEKQCHFWTVFEKTTVDEQTKKPKTFSVGMCSFKWLPHIMIETRNAIDRMNHGIHAEPADPNKRA